MSIRVLKKELGNAKIKNLKVRSNYNKRIYEFIAQDLNTVLNMIADQRVKGIFLEDFEIV